MASAPISSLILFIAAMLIAAGVAGTLVTNINEVSNSIDDYSGDVKEKIDTEIDVISDAGSDSIYDADNATITLLVKNTGSKTLANETSQLDVTVDGEYVSGGSLNMTVVDGEPWRPGDVVRLEIDRSLATGEEHRVVVIANGDRAEFEFYVP